MVGPTASMTTHRSAMTFVTGPTVPLVISLLASFLPSSHSGLLLGRQLTRHILPPSFNLTDPSAGNTLPDSHTLGVTYREAFSDVILHQSSMFTLAHLALSPSQSLVSLQCSRSYFIAGM